MFSVSKSSYLERPIGLDWSVIRPACGDFRDLARGSLEGQTAGQRSILRLQRLCWPPVVSVSL